MALQGMEKRKKAFQERPLFLLYSRATSTRQPALLSILAIPGQYCRPLVVTQGLQETRTLGAVVGQLGDLAR